MNVHNLMKFVNSITAENRNRICVPIRIIEIKHAKEQLEIK